MNVPTLTLNDGNTIPQLGFGTYQVETEEAVATVAKALEVGYRHIDTAALYGNEREVGEALRNSGIKREELYVTTKLWNDKHKPEDARKAFEASLERLGLEYVDLYLIHWPVPSSDYVATWRTLAEFKEDGRARSIGVSNFQVAHLEKLAAETDVVPTVNQIEAHPYFLNDEVRRYNREHDIETEAWSPIAQGGVLDDSTITPIAQSLNKTPAQIVLRWHLQRGDIIFPKSATPSRIEENFAIFDFELSSEQMNKISSLDKGEAGRTGPNPDELDEA